jgi:hypothetical protein
MKNNKSPGIDNIQVELIKMDGYDQHKYLHELITRVWHEEHSLRNGERAFYAQYTKKDILWIVKTTEEYLF